MKHRRVMTNSSRAIVLAMLSMPKVRLKTHHQNDRSNRRWRHESRVEGKYLDIRRKFPTIFARSMATFQ